MQSRFSNRSTTFIVPPPAKFAAGSIGGDATETVTRGLCTMPLEILVDHFVHQYCTITEVHRLAGTCRRMRSALLPLDLGRRIVVFGGCKIDSRFSPNSTLKQNKHIAYSAEDLCCNDPHKWKTAVENSITKFNAAFASHPDTLSVFREAILDLDEATLSSIPKSSRAALRQNLVLLAPHIERVSLHVRPDEADSPLATSVFTGIDGESSASTEFRSKVRTANIYVSFRNFAFFYPPTSPTPPSSMKPLAKLLRLLPPLKRLALHFNFGVSEGNRFEDVADWSALYSGMEALQPTLEELTWDFANVRSNVHGEQSVLGDFIRGASSLRKLAVRPWCMELRGLFEALAENARIAIGHLEITFDDVYDTLWEDWLENHTKKAVIKGSLRTLEYLQVSLEADGPTEGDYDCTDVFISTVLTNTSGLKTLVTAGDAMSMSPRSWQAIAHPGTPALSALRIDNDTICCSVNDAVSHGALRMLTSLHLEIVKCNAEDLRGLYRLFALPTLQHLNFRAQHLDVRGVASRQTTYPFSGAELASSITNHRALREIDIAFTISNPETVGIALSTIRSLTRVTLRLDDATGDVWMGAVLTGFIRNADESKLSVLHIRDIRFHMSQAGALKQTDLIQSCMTLVERIRTMRYLKLGMFDFGIQKEFAGDAKIKAALRDVGERRAPRVWNVSAKDGEELGLLDDALLGGISLCSLGIVPGRFVCGTVYGTSGSVFFRPEGSCDSLTF